LDKEGKNRATTGLAREPVILGHSRSQGAAALLQGYLYPRREP